MSTVPADGRHGWRLRVQAWSAPLLLLSPLLVVLLALHHRRRGRSLDGLRQALGVDLPRVAGRPVVVHGVSLGEVALMKAVLPSLSGPLLLTTTTPSGWEGLAQRHAGLPRCRWPLDLPWAVEAFLRRVKPRAVVLLEAELWPVMLAACHARGIPVLIANARSSPRSFARMRAIRCLVRPLLRNLRLVAAQTPDYGARLLHLGVRRERIAVTGSLKADLVAPADAAALDWCAANGLDVQRPLLLLASTSAGEEAALLVGGPEAWWARTWQLAICPRHVERGDELARLCVRLGGLPRRTSLGEALGSRPNEILIIDQIGRLGALYAHTARSGGIAVVGGSCGSGRGGQNMLEAAAAGCCTVVGWDTRAQPDPMAVLRRHQAVVELEPGRIAPALSALAEDRARRVDLGQRAQAAWRTGRGALARLERLIAAFV